MNRIVLSMKESHVQYIVVSVRETPALNNLKRETHYKMNIRVDRPHVH